MREIDAHSLAVLEFPKVKAIIAGLTLSPYGRRQAEGARPLFNRNEITLRLRRSAQMQDIIRFEEMIPLERQEDIRDAVKKAAVSGNILDPKELLQIKNFLGTIIDLAAYGREEERQEKFPDIVDVLKRLHPRPEIAKAIGKAVEPTGEIADGASGVLKQIRRDLSRTSAHINQHLEKILSSRRKHSGWQDDMVTVREGRYVIPVLSGDFKSDEGIVHDKSHSGATLFVEPSSAIPMNNKLRQLQQDEKEEVRRILKDLTAMVGEAKPVIVEDLDTFGLLDFIHAQAHFAIKTDAASPEIVDDTKLDLIDARHPLLLYNTEDHESVIPLSIALDHDTQGILVTGPNTGGKTVALKTIGLLTLLAMSGIEIPADHKSTVGIFKKIYADIGDEQSLELSLSTFSSHIRNIIAALIDADDNTLVLLDEIGAGTDPKEGSALAEVIILRLLQAKSTLIATTHYSQLKTLPLEHPNLLNASLEFDRDNLQPTFKLHIGHPGASYAIDIAQRLGLATDLAEQAQKILGREDRSLDGLIEKLNAELEKLQTDRRSLEDRLKKSRMLEEYYEARAKQVEEKAKDLEEDYVARLEKELDAARKDMNRLIKEIRESQAARQTIKKGHLEIDQKKAEIRQRRKELDQERKKRVAEERDGRFLKAGDRVWIERLQSEGEVVEMIGEKKAKVAIGSAFFTVDTIDLVRVDKTNKKTSPSSRKRGAKVDEEMHREPFNPEIMLRGMTVEEALEKLEKFLDSAVVAGVQQVYVIHGKGTGTLRKSVSAFLTAHSAVESIRIGDWNEGGHGVTIVRMKR